MPSVKKTKDGKYKVVGGTFSYIELIDFVIAIFRCLNGKASAYKKDPPPVAYSAGSAVLNIQKPRKSKQKDVQQKEDEK